jgi:hypothetical protein
VLEGSNVRGSFPDILALLQITADSNLKYQVSQAAHWDRKKPRLGGENASAV